MSAVAANLLRMNDARRLITNSRALTKLYFGHKGSQIQPFIYPIPPLSRPYICQLSPQSGLRSAVGLPQIPTDIHFHGGFLLDKVNRTSSTRKRYNHANPNQAQGQRNSDRSGYRKYIGVASMFAVFAGYALSQYAQSDCDAKKQENPAKNYKTSNSHCVRTIQLQTAIHLSRDLAQKIKDEVGSPGLVITVSVDGREVWSEGMGYADLENRVPCESETVMRIASISKAITMTIVARLMEQGKLDLDKPVQNYVAAWPKKTFQGEEVAITTRQLVSHMSGIRHYDRTCGKKEKEVPKKTPSNGDKNATEKVDKAKQPSEFEMEYYLKKRYNSVTDSLNLFKDNELCFKPGTKYLYTTHGWTLISAVVEAASGKKFPDLCQIFFKDLGMDQTFLDENEPLIYKRSRYYCKNKKGRIVNTPYVDNSYKWAGGGFLSSTPDLVKFGNAMLYSYGHGSSVAGSRPPGYVTQKTMRQIWTPVTRTKADGDLDDAIAMGWFVVPEKVRHGQCRVQRNRVYHAGGAVGASSVLLLLPRREAERHVESEGVRGVVVAIIVNLTSVSLSKTALEIAKTFEQVDMASL